MPFNTRKKLQAVLIDVLSKATISIEVDVPTNGVVALKAEHASAIARIVIRTADGAVPIAWFDVKDSVVLGDEVRFDLDRLIFTKD